MRNRPMASRVQRSAFNEWWWTVDRVLLGALVTLMLVGVVLLLAASPAVAERIGIDNMFHFVNRQAFFLVPAMAVMLGVSFMSPRAIRRFALCMFFASAALVVCTLLFGVEVKGSRRWILGIQPSEFLKPAFVVLTAWLFSEGIKRRDVPGNLLACLLLVLSAGLHLFWVLGLAGLGAGGIFAAYLFIPHVTHRINKFLNPVGSATFQADTAMESFVGGGWFGKGPGEGTVKRILPDSHTDFIMAVTAEEFGIVFCMVIVILFGFIVVRGLWHALKLEDPFCRFATAGL